MTDQTNPGAAVVEGVKQAVIAAAPAIAMAAAASDPKLQAALVAAQALAPAVAALVDQFNNQQLTHDELEVKITELKLEAMAAHNDWLASIEVPHG